MTKFGLIGYPLTHSFSKKFFEEKFKREGIAGNSYSLFPIENIEGLSRLLAGEPELEGLNVTIPHKESVIPYLDELDDTAKTIGAVNCIKIVNRYLKGYNTDAPAFEQSLKNFLTAMPEQTFVLGSGGSAKAVCYALKNMNIPFLQVSRQCENDRIGYSDITENMKKANLFINTTPLGMFPTIERFPDIPYAKLSSNDFLFDLVYNPDETAFLKLGKVKGASVKNGLEMLQLQAEMGWGIWTNKD
jgi:shikimate dehydrogenase